MHRVADFDRPLTPPPFPVGVAALLALMLGLVALDFSPSFSPMVGIPVRAATLAAVIGGAHALFRSLERLSEGRVGADLAIALAAVAALLIDEPSVAAEVVAISLAGELLEAWTAGRASRSLTALATLFPERCWVVREGQEVRTFTRDLLVGDVVVVKPGGKIPGDGLVLSGTAAVVTAALTGESWPRSVGPGDSVLAGAVVPDGSLGIRLTRVGADSAAGQVIAFTEAALRNKGQSERQADRYARLFLPVVLGLTLATFVVSLAAYGSDPGPTAGRAGWTATARRAAYPALAVLVVACPCPLVLATPAAVAAALGRLAGTGILVKGGVALERLARVTAVAVDKTGTLTTGELRVGEPLPAAGHGVESLLRLAGAAARGSDHPASIAIAQEVAARGLISPESQTHATPGLGVHAVTADGPVFVGSARYLEAQGVALPAGLATQLDEVADSGAGAVLVAVSGVFAGLIPVRDQVRPEAAGVVAELTAMGLPVTLLTGDRSAAVVSHLPLAQAHANLLPLEKVARLPANCLYVGDGLNDAPALAAASAGVAVGHSPAVVGAVADVVMLGEPLRDLPLLVRLSREAVRTVRQNIVVFGFGVNLSGVALTAWLWPILAPDAVWVERGPVAAAVFHQVGSLAVILNSMRLLRFERAATPAGRLLATLRRFDADEALHAALHRWRELLAAGFALAVLAWLGSGVTAVKLPERALLARFGARRGDLGPGLHLRYPWPIETRTVYRPAEPRLIEIGFRRASAETIDHLQAARVEQARLRGGEPTDLGWESAHPVEFERLADESTYATGDGNLAELLATVRVRVADPAAYFIGTAEPDALIRAAAEGALREQVAARPLTRLLTEGRAELARAAVAALRSRLPESVGVEVVDLTVHDLHPPTEVAADFHAVAAAMQARDRAVNAALAEATRTRATAEILAAGIRRESRADAATRALETAAAADAFAARADQLADTPPDHRHLTEFRLTLAASAELLAGRPKILIDSTALPGRRSLLVIDPALTPLLPPAKVSPP